MTAWFKLLEKRCRDCAHDRFCLAHTKLSTVIFCDHCGALFEERPIGRHMVIDHVEPVQLDLPISS